MIKYMFAAIISGSDSHRQKCIDLIAKRAGFYCVIPSKIKSKIPLLQSRTIYFFFFDTRLGAWKAKKRLRKESSVFINYNHVTKTEVSEDIINAESQKSVKE